MSDTPQITLHRARWNTDLPGAATAVFAGRDATAFLISPRAATAARWDGHAFTGVDGPLTGTAVADVYEAQCFNENHHVRWYRPQHPGAAGAAVVIGEYLPPLAVETTATQPVRCVGRLPQRYLLWKVPTEPARTVPAGWTWVQEARIAGFAVPASPPPPGGRLCLETFEYLTADDDLDGNTYVLDERYVAIRVAPAAGDPTGGPRTNEDVAR